MIDASPPAPDPAPHPIERIEGDLASGLLLLCDHASNTVPPEYGGLGLPAAELSRHIAYDIGAAGLTRALAARLRAPALLTRFSRLVIDPNRGRDDPTLVMRLSDRAIVPGNARIDAGEIERRIARFLAPYDEAIAGALGDFAAAGIVPAILSIHSYTPAMRGVPRPWHAAILWDCDPRLARPLIAALRAEPGLMVGDNQPYDGALEGDTLDRHAAPRGLPSALLEVRQDLVTDEAGERAWADRLARALQPILGDPALREARHYISRAGAPRRHLPA